MENNSKLKATRKLNTTVATNDCTFRIEEESPDGEEETVNRFLNITLD